jgi:hypothetical protein
MKIAALHDSKGRILAAVHLTPNYNGPVPVRAKGAKYIELSVPEEHAKSGLAHVCQNFRVHPKTRQLVGLTSNKR